MKQTINEMDINGTIYVPKDSIQSAPAQQLDGMKYCMVRTYSAGVFAGYVKSRDGKEIELKKARRIWGWSGAASLSQLATEGTSKPGNCKFPCEVDSITLTEAIEIIPITDKAKKSINEVKVWEQ